MMNPGPARLRAFLRPGSDMEIVGECGNRRTGGRGHRSMQPQLVFLDVQMPGMDGFAVLQALEPRHCPWSSSSPPRSIRRAGLRESAPSIIS
jgi:DNA-binding NarL/FixJ family response regulator